MDSFNLIDRPWIPVIRTDGTPDTVSLRGLYAPDVRDVACAPPSQTMAVIRLATAITCRALPTSGSVDEDAAAFRTMLAADHAPQAIFDYLDKWHDRFDLMGDRPFMQSSGLPESDTLTPLVSDVETNGTLAARADRFILTAAQAALWLIRCQAYDGAANRATLPGDTRMKGSICYTNGTGWTGSLGCLAILGDTMWRTTLLNRVPLPWDTDADWSRDSAVWERDIPTFGDPEYDAGKGVDNDLHGPAALLTWRSRSIRLSWRDGMAVGATVTAGDRIHAQDANAYEPMSGWHESGAKGGLVSTRLPSSAPLLWRGLAGLLAVKDGGKRPMNVRWLERARLEPMRLRYLYTAVEWGPQCQNPVGETADTLACTLDLSRSRTAGRRYADRLALLDRGVGILARLDRDLQTACGDTVPATRAGLYARLWGVLDPPTRTWLASDNPMGTLDRWTAACLRLLARHADRMADGAPARAWSGRMGADGKTLSAAVAFAECHACLDKLGKELA
jgi:CRISPR system Cascade subunit CasA